MPQLLGRIIADVNEASRGGIASEIRLAQLLEETEDKQYRRDRPLGDPALLLIPIILVYPFLQKYFAKGILIGSLKGRLE